MSYTEKFSLNTLQQQPEDVNELWEDVSVITG
jgi:hypothetical protein